MTTNNRATLTQDSTPKKYAKLLRGRYATDITISSDETSATLTLDNDTTLNLHGNRECSFAETGHPIIHTRHPHKQTRGHCATLRTTHT